MRDTAPEVEKLRFEMVMKRSSRERIKIASAMFVTARKAVIASMPTDLSPREFKKLLYFRTYGEYLPADFPFRDGE